MFTNNYINYQKLMFSYDPYWGYSTDKTFKNTQGNTFTADFNYCTFGGVLQGVARNGKCQALPTTQASSASGSGYGLYFGRGSTPATKEDYKLEDVISSGLSIANPKASNVTISQESEGRYVVEYTYTLTNTTSEDINIYEVGLFTPLGANSSTWHLVMMNRKVLTEPITIPSGGSKIVSYKIVVNQILNVEA